MNRPVTELDLRAPEFKEGAPDEYEFREDGRIVRKDRWERGIRSIAVALHRRTYDIPELVEEVQKLVATREAAEEIDFCILIDKLIASWCKNGEETQEVRDRRIQARADLEAALKRILPEEPNE